MGSQCLYSDSFLGCFWRSSWGKCKYCCFCFKKRKKLNWKIAGCSSMHIFNFQFMYLQFQLFYDPESVFVVVHNQNKNWNNTSLQKFKYQIFQWQGWDSPTQIFRPIGTGHQAQKFNYWKWFTWTINNVFSAAASIGMKHSDFHSFLAEFFTEKMLAKDNRLENLNPVQWINWS